MTVPVMEKKIWNRHGYRRPEAAQTAVGQINPNAAPAGDVPSYNYQLFGTGLIRMRSPAL
jgi:hypothetical protein